MLFRALSSVDGGQNVAANTQRNGGFLVMHLLVKVIICVSTGGGKTIAFRVRIFKWRSHSSLK